jgi:hypothetical protein
LGHMACQYEGKAAKCVNILVHIGKAGVNVSCGFLQRSTGVGFPQAVFERDERCNGCIIMFIFDFTNNFFD